MEKYNIIVEKDSEENYIASVQGMQGMYTQGKTFEEVISNIKEVILVWKEIDKNREKPLEFVGLQLIQV